MRRRQRLAKSKSAPVRSPDHCRLYVTNNQTWSLSVIDLGLNRVLQIISLPAKPEGVEVGSDGRAAVALSNNGTAYLYDGMADNCRRSLRRHRPHAARCRRRSGIVRCGG